MDVYIRHANELDLPIIKHLLLSYRLPVEGVE
jgi:hypothetical protein